MNELTPKQKAFCEEYLLDLNATQAAARAGYSEKTSNEQGARLLANVSVKKYIDELKESRSERTQITSDYVLSGIKETTEQARKEDNLTASFKGYELLGKHLKLFTDKIEHSGVVGIDEALAGINEPNPDELAEDET